MPNQSKQSTQHTFGAFCQISWLFIHVIQSQTQMDRCVVFQLCFNHGFKYMYPFSDQNKIHLLIIYFIIKKKKKN